MKKTKTFTIDEKILKRFGRISSEESLNKSLFIENCIKKYIEEYDKRNENKNKNI